MSYNNSPTWTDKFSVPNISDMQCPVCGMVAENAAGCAEILQTGNYYEPRHIPPALLLTCSNPECPHCDGDYSVELSATIEIHRIKKA